MINSELKKLLLDKTLYQFGRALYKYVDCGPWVVFTLLDKDGEESEVYYEDKEANVTLEDLEKQGTRVTAIKVGSIVEGSEFDVEPISLDVDDKFTTDAFWSAVASIDEEATQIWKAVNATYYSVRVHGTDKVVVWCEWEDFAYSPRVPDISQPDYGLALEAGRLLLDSVENRIEFAGRPDLYIQREDPPDLI